jgi:hypothetical protein
MMPIFAVASIAGDTAEPPAIRRRRDGKVFERLGGADIPAATRSPVETIPTTCPHRGLL